MNSKHFRITAIIVLVIAIGAFGWYRSVEADSSSTPGNVDDPIVTKSYVDQSVAKLVKEELGKLGDNSGSSTKLEVVTVPLGTKILVADGGELIVRSGKAVAYSADTNGLSDMTDGLDIAPSKAVAANHLILFPRGGRGVEADPKQKNGLIVLVRGAYQLQ
jgi:hypothetical protein